MMKQLLIGVAMVAAVSGCSKGGDPKAVAQDFVTRMTSGNCAGLKDMVLASQRDLQGSAAEMGCDAMTKSGTPAPPAPTFGDATVNGDDATVPVTEAAGGTPHTLKLKKENGVWKIDVNSFGL